jgi:hypothetical protein
MRGNIAILVAAIAAGASVHGAEDARAIISRSVLRDVANQRLMRDYTYNVLSKTTELDKAGKPKSVHSETHEVLYFGGKAHRRLVAKDGKPLPGDEERKEQDKVNKVALEASKLTPEQVRKREEESTRLRRRQTEELENLPDAFDFRILEEPVVDGRPTWKIQAEPNLAYRGKDHGILKNLHGTLWIDKKDYQWVRVESETLDNISIGLFVFRLGKGSLLVFENQRVNDEVWAPRRVWTKATLRLAVLKKFNQEQEVVFTDYRKFRTDATVTSVGEPR